MLISKKLATIAALVLILSLMSISTGESRDRSTTQTEPQTMGPYDIAVLPLEEIPEPGPEVYRQRVKTSHIYESSYATPEILRVLKDPRSIPLDRFLYYKDPFQSSRNHPKPPEHLEENYARRIEQSKSILKHPDADQIIDRFTNDTPAAVAVYVRSIGGFNSKEYDVNGTPSQHTWGLLDPFYVQDPVNDFFIETSTGIFPVNFPWNPWSPLGVSDPESSLVFPCMPQQVFHPGEPYENPDTGNMIDPASFLPPKPWYGADSIQIYEGEVREGWLLCLAPDIPVDEIELVALEAYERDAEESNNLFRKNVVWTTPYYKQMGEWHLLPDTKVLGWNNTQINDSDGMQSSAPQVIYQGDVWISIASSIFHQTNPNTLEYPLRMTNLQISFAGMEDFLRTWDHVALKKELLIGRCQDQSLENCHVNINTDLIDVAGTWFSESSDSLEIDSYPYFFISGPGETISDFPPTGRTHPHRLFAWHLEPQLISVPVLSTHGICELEEVECLPDVLRIKFDDGELGEPFVYDGPIPIIPFGQSANGIRVLGAYTDETAILEIGYGYDLDLRIRDASTAISDSQWLFVILEVQGMPNSIHAYHEIDEGLFDFGTGSEVIFYTSSGPYTAIRNNWITQFRQGLSNIGIIGPISYNNEVGQFVLIIREDAGGGPAYELKLNE